MNVVYILKTMLLVIIIFFASCKYNKQKDNVLKIGISPMTSLFSFVQNGELVGFRVDLIKLIAKELNIEIEFHQMEWFPMLPSLTNGIIDIIAHVGVTDARKKKFDFSDSYYKNELAIIFLRKNPVLNRQELEKKKIISVFGYSEIINWWEQNIQGNQLILVDFEALGIQTLKANNADGFLLFKEEAKFYCKKNPELDYFIIPNEFTNVAIIMRKNSPLLPKINQAIDKLKKNGEVQRLKDKWLEK